MSGYLLKGLFFQTFFSTVKVPDYQGLNVVFHKKFAYY